MTKWYGKRNNQGDPMLYHSAPGAHELNIPKGDTPEDYEKLIPEYDKEAPMAQYQSQQSRHPFWDSWLGRFFGGDSAGAAWRMVQVFGFMWGIYQFVGMAKDTIQELHSDTQKVERHEIFERDTLRPITKALGSPRNIETYQSAANLGLKIANKHFPKDVQEFQQQMQWSAGANSFKIDRDERQ